MGLRRVLVVDDDVTIADSVAARLRALHQVVANLLDNAARHSPAGAEIVVRARPLTPAGLVLEVVDREPGIPSTEHATSVPWFETNTARNAARARLAREPLGLCRSGGYSSGGYSSGGYSSGGYSPVRPPG